MNLSYPAIIALIGGYLSKKYVAPFFTKEATSAFFDPRVEDVDYRGDSRLIDADSNFIMGPVTLHLTPVDKPFSIDGCDKLLSVQNFDRLMNGDVQNIKFFNIKVDRDVNSVTGTERKAIWPIIWSEPVMDSFTYIPMGRLVKPPWDPYNPVYPLWLNNDKQDIYPGDNINPESIVKRIRFTKGAFGFKVIGDSSVMVGASDFLFLIVKNNSEYTVYAAQSLGLINASGELIYLLDDVRHHMNVSVIEAKRRGNRINGLNQAPIFDFTDEIGISVGHYVGPGQGIWPDSYVPAYEKIQAYSDYIFPS